MAVGMHKMRLGRSLASLIGEGEGAEFGEMEGQRIVALDTLKAGRFNPRRNFSGAQIEELAVSIRERGLVQPLVVRPVRGEHESYEIVAGERRRQGKLSAGELHSVAAISGEADHNRFVRGMRRRFFFGEEMGGCRHGRVLHKTRES